jgi:hypothetical protein
MRSELRPKLLLVGWVGPVGGATSKNLHLVKLLRDDFDITVVPFENDVLQEKPAISYLASLGISCVRYEELPGSLTDVAVLAVCVRDFFSSGRAASLKDRGAKLFWSNEMMWPFEGEAEAAKAGLIDRVVYLSDFQAAEFATLHAGVPKVVVENYVDADDFPFFDRPLRKRAIGRLSRPDPVKYPTDFPVFYEALGLEDACYRVMAWSDKLKDLYNWHHFGPQWEFLSVCEERPCVFLHSIDLFVYSLSPFFKESWGRSVVEAALTGCVPLVPAGHHFAHLIVHGQTGYTCGSFAEFAKYSRLLWEDGSLYASMSRSGAEHAREVHANPFLHRRIWRDALAF